MGSTCRISVWNFWNPSRTFSPPGLFMLFWKRRIFNFSSILRWSFCRRAPLPSRLLGTASDSNSSSSRLICGEKSNRCWHTRYFKGGWSGSRGNSITMGAKLILQETEDTWEANKRVSAQAEMTLPRWIHQCQAQRSTVYLPKWKIRRVKSNSLRKNQQTSRITEGRYV